MESALLLFQCYMCTCTFEWETCIPLLRLHGLITVKQNSLACQEQTDNIDCAITSVLFLLSYFLNSSQSFSNACGCVSFSVILSYWRSLMFKQCCCFHLYLSKSSSACLLTVDLCRNFSPGQCAFLSLYAFALLCFYINPQHVLFTSSQNGPVHLFLSIVNSLYSSPPGSRHPFLQRFLLDTAQAFSFPLSSLLLTYPVGQHLKFCIAVLVVFMILLNFNSVSLI